jgi:hypothetical protein
MIKTLGLFIVILLFGVNVEAQIYSLKIGKAVNTDSHPIKNIGIFGNNLYSINQLDDEYYLVKYELDSLKPIAYNLLDLSYQSKPMVYSDFIEIQGRFYLFTRFDNKLKNKSYFLYQEYSLNDLKTIGTLKHWSDSKSHKPNNISKDFIVGTSPDLSKKLIFNFTNSSFDENKHILISVYASDSLHSWQDPVEIPNSLNKLVINEVLISDEGIVYMLGIETLGTSHGKIQYRYTIMEYNHIGTKLNIRTVESGDSKILNLRMVLNSNNDIICVGVSHNTEHKPYNFVETYMLDTSNNRYKLQSRKPIKTYNIYQEEKQKKNKMPIFITKPILYINDTNMLFTAEQHAIQPIMFSVPPQYSFAYLNVSSFTIDDKANLKASEEFSKRQFLTKGHRGRATDFSDYYSPIFSAPLSYYVSTYKGKAFFLYNENINNINQGVWNKVFENNVKNSVPILAFLSGQKHSGKYVLQNKEDPRLMLLLNTAFQYKDKIYCFAKQDNQMVITEITFFK